jgi:NADH-quinone oxidoreductase subunit H
MPEFNIWYTVIFIAILIPAVLGAVAYATLAERKISAWVQDRIGPNRVGPFGLLQPLVDGGKFFLKEDVIPKNVDKIFFVLAPLVAFSTGLLGIAVVPVGPAKSPPDPQVDVVKFDSAQKAYSEGFNFVVNPSLDIGILWTFAIGSLAVYGVILAGWSANNKYALLGSLRSSAQIISYEIPLGMSIVSVLIFTGFSLNLEHIVAIQAQSGWNILYHPLAFLIFITAAAAECARLPFDLPECEQELVGGYHTEYSSLKLGMLLLAEFAHLITACFMMSVLFFGGWQFFGLENATSNKNVNLAIGIAILATKMILFVAFFILIRWTIPRFRFDQLMNLAWKVMIPLGLLNMVGAMFVRQFFYDHTYHLWYMTAISFVLFVGAGVWGLRTNNSITTPRRKVQQLPVGIPQGVTYASK